MYTKLSVLILYTGDYRKLEESCAAEEGDKHMSFTRGLSIQVFFRCQ